MKYQIAITLLLALMWTPVPISAQPIHWSCMKEQHPHMISVHAGMEFGFVYGIGYHYRVKNRLFPIMAGVEASFPSGPEIFDDFKVKIGGQVRWLELHHFQFSTRVQGVFRRYENDLVRLVNFGSDLSGVIGYYRTHWFFAAEAGFDKAIVTHFKHTQQYRDQYDAVVDGWYEPPTGGNFYYGIQTGLSLKRSDIYVRLGKVITQDFRTEPMLPVYAQLGYSIRF